MENLDQIRKLLLNITTEAGKYALSHFDFDRKLVTYKAKDGARPSPVTPVDLAIDELLHRRISETFPNHAIISEESAPMISGGTSVTWVIDPIDGTGNYIRGSKVWSACLAVIIDGQTAMGTIFSPALNNFYFVERGRGVLLNDQKLISKSVEVKNTCYFRDNKSLGLRVKELFPDRQIIREHLSCTSVEFSNIASSQAWCAVYEDIPLWDFAAGALMVEEMGGKVVDFDNKRYSIHSSNLVISGPKASGF